MKVDKLEGGVGRKHPAIVISSNTFNDSHSYGIIVRGSSSLPISPEPDQYVIKKTPGNGLDEDTVFLPIIQSTQWKPRVLKKVGTVSPYQLQEIMERLRAILEL